MRLRSRHAPGCLPRWLHRRAGAAPKLGDELELQWVVVAALSFACVLAILVLMVWRPA